MSRTLTLFVDPSRSEEADEVLSEVFGEPQTDSLRLHLSASGIEPATALGALARGLTNDQVDSLNAQSVITTIELPWTEALESQSLMPIPATIPEAN